MAQYYCGTHPSSQLGTIAVDDADVAAFEVSDLEPGDVTVTQGEMFGVGATITNVGGEEATQNIDLQIGDNTVASESLTIESGESETVSFDGVETADLEPNEYSYSVSSQGESQTATLTVADDDQADSPNVIVIMADDMGYGDTSVPPFTSDRDIPTPNLEEMAANGATFTSHYNGPAPACTPTRAALMTGSYHPRVGMGGGVYFPNADNGLHPDETTIADLLQQEDYTTGAIGKWHLGDRDPFLPPNQGFDMYLGAPYSNDMSPFPLIEGLDEVQEEAPNDQLTQTYTERALQFIEDNQDEPFFLYLPHTMSHVPLGVSDEFEGVTEDGLYGDVIRELDWSTGQILDRLEELGIEDETLVVFTTDDGPWLSKGENAGSSGPLRNGKQSTWEGGARVPTIMQMSGTIPAGTSTDEMTSHIDFLPTVANLTGADLPDVELDGKDLTNLLQNPETASSPHDYMLYYSGGLEAVRNAEGMKYRFDNDALYNLAEDIGESNDVSDDHPEIVSELQNYANSYDSELRENARPEGSLTNIAYVSISATISQDDTATVTFTNNRDVTVTDVELSVSTPTDGWSVEPQSSTAFDSVDAGSTAETEVQLTASDGSTAAEVLVHAVATYGMNGQEKQTAAAEPVEFVSVDPLPDQYSTFNNGSDNPVYGMDGDTLIIEGHGVPFGDSDEYTTVYLDDALPPEGTAVARIDDVEQVHEFSTADLVVRNDLAQPGESTGYASIPVNDTVGELKVDENSNGFFDDGVTGWDPPGLSVWLRIERNTTTYVASYSEDGDEWTEIDTFELDDANEMQDVGIALSGPEDHRAEIGEFSVQAGDGSLPARYSTFNNGSDDPFFGMEDGSLVIEGTGSVYEDTDEYSTIYLDDGLPSEGTAVVKVSSVDQVNESSTGGLVVRNDLTNPGESAGYALMSVNEDRGELKTDTDSDGQIALGEIQGFESGLPKWLRFERDGTTFVASHSSDGSDWTEIATFELTEATEPLDVGVITTANTDANHRATFDEFEVT